MNKLNTNLQVQQDRLNILSIIESILLHNTLYSELLEQY